jgi:hypothetical protein
MEKGGCRRVKSCQRDREKDLLMEQM